MSDISGSSLDMKSMVKKFGPITHIAMHPDFFEKLNDDAKISNKESPHTYKGYLIKITPLVKDWWPIWDNI